jgi:hypothetical protein
MKKIEITPPIMHNLKDKIILFANLVNFKKGKNTLGTSGTTEIAISSGAACFLKHAAP